ncbi:MAG: glutathione peroxidase [Spirochaetia bacterium]|nr:glutathione peroxidase [Sphaerochaeta sp.]NCC64398.1 glutathione peroxidase [Spirochaetia bacterium]
MSDITTKSLYDFTAKTNKGSEFSFSSLKGKPVLIVNTASKCGFTVQYAGLEKLYQEYKDKGLTIIAFPCDQFAHQEKGSDAEIAEFCKVNFGVTFPLMTKIEVNGKQAHPLYVWLKKQAPGTLGSTIKWNFTKFLVHGDGTTVQRFAPTDEPETLRPFIEEVL